MRYVLQICRNLWYFCIMESLFERFIRELRDSGKSVTTARQEVFRAMMTEEPLSISQLVAKLKNSVDRASIYRTVSLFEQLGIIIRLQIGWKYKLELSEEYSTHHHHITCVRCGDTSPIVEDELLEASINELAYHAGFIPSSHQLEIRGVCAYCRGLKQPAVLSRT